MSGKAGVGKGAARQEGEALAILDQEEGSLVAAHRAAEEAQIVGGEIGGRDIKRAAFVDVVDQRRGTVEFMCAIGAIEESGGGRPLLDRKSTRMKSSH